MPRETTHFGGVKGRDLLNCVPIASTFATAVAAPTAQSLHWVVEGAHACLQS